MLQRIAIVNRGEAAMRLIHAVRDLNAQAGPGGHRIETVALHTEAERSAMFVRESDAAYDLGPASLRPYLDHAVLERALVQVVSHYEPRLANVKVKVDAVPERGDVAAVTVSADLSIGLQAQRVSFSLNLNPSQDAARAA